MQRFPPLADWIEQVADHFPHLSKPQASGLALWSLGLILARSCTLTAVAGLLAPLLGQSFNTVRERLRDTYREAEAKRGLRRSALERFRCISGGYRIGVVYAAQSKRKDELHARL